jgi:hypothetical protein
MGQRSFNGSQLIRLVSKRPGQMLAAYLANMERGAPEVREMILEDIRRFSDLGAVAYVEDLKEALFRFDEAAFLAACPTATMGNLVSIGH